MKKTPLLYSIFSLCCSMSMLFSSAQLITWPVRNTTGDYDEQIMTGSASCYMYAMPYTGTWRGYVECLDNDPQCYAGFAESTLENLGNICYRSRIDAGTTLRGGYGWYGGNKQEYLLACRRNYQISFENLPSSSIGFELYYTKAEIDALIASFNALHGTNKTYNDLVIINYKGPNQDLSPDNNSTTNGDFQKIVPNIVFYGTGSQYAYAEFNVTNYGEFYLGLTTPNKNIYVNDSDLSGDLFTTAIGDNINPGTKAAPVATIEYALSIALPGDTILVDAGGYSPGNITIDKSITIRGANYLISPNNASNPLLLNTSRNSEATISDAQITLAANDITLEGLMFFTPASNQFTLSSTAVANDLCNNIRLTRNLFAGLLTPYSGTLFTLTGKSSNPASTTGFLVQDNRIETAINVVMRIDNFNNFTISKNAFIKPQIIPSTLAIRHNAGRFENLTVEDNTFQNWDATVFTGGGVVKNLVYTNNKAYNTQRGLQFNGNLATEPATIVVSNNLFQQHASAGNTAVLTINRTAAVNASSPNSIKVESNTIVYNGTGQTLIPSTLLIITCNNSGTGDPLSSNHQVMVRKNNIFYAGNLSTASNTFPFAAQIVGAIARADIDSNEIRFSATNLGNPTSDIILRNTGIIIGNTPLIPAGAVFNIHSNKISGFKQSLIFFAGSQYGGLAPGVTVYVNNNSFTGDSISINNGTSSQPVNASCNWYGEQTLPYVSGKVSPATVSYMPWLNNGTDDDPATIGFQPVPGSCNSKSKYYVNDNNLSGDVFTTAIGSNTNPGTKVAPVASINYAISLAQPGDTILVDAGLYTEDIVVNKPVVILGVQKGMNPGNLLSRGAESILVAATHNPVDGAVVTIQSGDITIDGFIIDGDNPLYTGTVALNGVDINSGFAIARFINNTDAHNNLIFKNNIIKNVYRYGIFLQSTNTLPLSGNLITQNRFDNIPALSVEGVTGRQGRAVGLANNGYASVTNNVFTRVHSGIWMSGFNTTTQNEFEISGNAIECYRLGIAPGGFSGTAAHYTINNNSIATAALNTWNVPGGSSVNSNTGIIINNSSSAAGMEISDNVINGVNEGLVIGRISGSNNWLAKGNQISNSTGEGIYYFSSIASNSPIIFENTTLQNNLYGIYVDYLGAGGPLPVSFSNVSVVGGTTGLHLKGSQVSLPGNLLSGISFSGQSGNYIQLVNNALNGLTIDASSIMIEGKLPADMTSAELFAAEDKIAHSIDYNGVGFIRLKPSHVYVTVNSFSSSLPAGWGATTLTTDINRAVASAAEEDIIYIAAGTYANQVTIDKGLTIIGAGQDLTSIVMPAGAPVPPPGPFAEIGVIQTAQNIGDVHIQDLSVTGVPTGITPIILQTGGSVRNCRLQNGNQGIFFRVESAVKSAEISNNIIDAEYIAVNFQGSNLTASLTNNNLAVHNQEFSAGVFAGLDFGPLPQFTATNNNIVGFYTQGLHANSYNGTISQNNITGPGSTAILQTSGNAINANCNWYGGQTMQFVSGKIIPATINYAPWLTNGTDSDPATGFQPTAGSCNGTAPVITINNKSNISCFGANNGSIDISVPGGTAPYTYAWSKDEEPGFSASSEDLNSLPPGNYSLTVTDALGSIVSVDVNINEPELLTASASGTNNICFAGNLGTASVEVSGGTAPYNYSWNSGASTESLAGLIAGGYSVTVTDANGCTASSNYTVTEPTQLIATASGTSTSCVNSATVVASGGTGSYSYLWNNGATTSSISSIPAGTYSVNVTDQNGCIAMSTVTVTGNQAFNPSVTTANVTCFGTASGSLTVTNANGVAPFSYSLDGISFQPSNVFNNLLAGTYTVTVKDALGCTGFNTKAITQPTELTASVLSVQSTCGGQSTGSISVGVAGGSPAYSYSWTGPNSYTSNKLNIANLAVGNHSLTVTDSKGCTAILHVNLTAFPAISVSSIVSNVLCKAGTNGSIVNTVSGGTGTGFNYLWNGGFTTKDRSNLGAGNYTLTITDAGSGCTEVRSFTITQPATAVSISTTKSNATGCSNPGTITINGSGGTGPYTYSIDAVHYFTNNVFGGLAAGSYTASVMDANGCNKSAAVAITDNGSDEYEGNNSKNQSKSIPIGTPIYARIALATDVDWFKFTTPAGSNDYLVTLTHPSASFAFNVYPTGNNAAALVPVSNTATGKSYTLAGNTTYYIQVTGGLSYTCYELSVLTNGLITRSVSPQQLREIASDKGNTDFFDVVVFGNPTATEFKLQVKSSNMGSVKLSIYDVTGRMLEKKENILPAELIRVGRNFTSGVYIAEIVQGEHRKTIRLVKQ